VFRLIDVRAHGYDAADAMAVSFTWARGRSVHDGVFGAAEEVGGATEA
jgi:hypothetical protein